MKLRIKGLEIICPVEKSQVALAITKKAYQLGASIVRVRWSCEGLDKLNYTNATTKELCDIPKWLVESKNDLVKRNFCYVAISSENPKAFDGIPAEKISAVNVAKSKAMKKFFENVTTNKIRWCVVSVPTKEWAKVVFPQSKNAEQDLANAIIMNMRLDKEDPIAEWNKHVEQLDSHVRFLNENNFEYLEFTNKSGTNLKVGLCQDHVWQSAKELAWDGVSFIANLPTEEVFTAPHRLKVEGTVKGAKPLCINGQIIDRFSLTFKKGKIVDFSAEVGYDALKSLIHTDSGTCRLGEVALIGKNSPIAKSGILFYNTLFDENASCHVALGKAYPTTVKNGNSLSIKQLTMLGANNSIEHEDLMIGTPDVNVVGITHNGKRIQLLEDGDWVI